MSDPAARERGSLSGASLLLGLGLSCAYLILLIFFQPTVTFMQGRGWDGFIYYTMAESDLPAAERAVPGRYKTRVLVPALARAASDRLPEGSTNGRDRLLTGFRIVNLAAGLIAAVLSWVFLVSLHQGRLGLVALGLCWSLIAVTHVSPLPEAAWYPTQTDTLSNLFVLLVIYLALCRRHPFTPLACTLVFGLGTLTREHFPIFLILFGLRFELGLSRERLSSAQNRDTALRVAGAVVGSALGLLFLVRVVGVNPLEGRAEYAFSELASIAPGTVLAALINVYGATLLVVLAARASTTRVRHDHPLGVRGVNLALVMGVLALISFGWSNNERFLYWALPALVFYFASEIDGAVRSGFDGRVALGAAAVLAVVFNRSWLPIEASGVGPCNLGSIVAGTSAWVGHWVQTCGPNAELWLVVAYVVACAAIVALAARAWRSPQAT